MDLGGGSLEVALGDDAQMTLVTSTAVGPARLRGELGTGDPLSEEDRRVLCARTVEAVAPIAAQVRGGRGWPAAPW